MARIQSLAEHLGIVPASSADAPLRFEGVVSAEKFAEAVLSSNEFWFYVVNSLTLGTLPSAIVLRLMDYAPLWGKPVERVEVDDRSQRLEDLTPEILEERLARIQRMLWLLRAAQAGETLEHPEGEVMVTSVH